MVALEGTPPQNDKPLSQPSSAAKENPYFQKMLRGEEDFREKWA
jgi:hypothetical protein